MQGGRGGRDPFFGFGDPFAGFGGFGGFGGQRSLMSSFFGGRDPFDDPFFTRPFGGMFESNFFGPSGNPFTNMQPTSFIEHEAPQPKRSRGPIIEELNSDDEEAVKGNNPRKHGRSSNGPFVEDPDDEIEGRSNKYLQYGNDYGQYSGAQQQPQTRSFTFSSSSVTYGGPNGAYYASSTSRRTGSDGLTIEESKEADSASRQATHRISKGLHNKGHSLTRKLNSDGQVNAVQTLHNLNEDELAGFEDAWNVKAKKHLPGWTGSSSGHIDMGGSVSGQNEQQVSRGGWALPSTEGSQNSERLTVDRSGSSRTQHRGRMKNTSDVGERMGNPRGGRSRD